MTETESDYTCPEPFLDLYHVYTGDHTPESDTIGTKLASTIAATTTGIDGPLIIVNNSHVVVYQTDNELGNKFVAGCDYRDSPTTGFYELASVSHVAPALMSLVLLQEKGETDEVNRQLTKLKTQLDAVQKINAKPIGQGNQHWLEQLQNPAWHPWVTEIRAMVDYACDVASKYVAGVLAGTTDLNFDTLQAQLFQPGPQTGNIGFNNPMVATFVLSALTSVYKVHAQLSSLTADEWQKAGVIIQSFPGEIADVFLDENGLPNRGLKTGVGKGSRRYFYGNLTSGLTEFTNWWVPLLQMLSGKKDDGTYNLKKNHIFIVPYATLLQIDGDPPESLPAFDWKYYRETVWNGLYFRGMVAAEAMQLSDYDFPPICGIVKQGYTVPTAAGTEAHDVWPGDYELGSVSDFLKRIKHSFADTREMLSNCVAFWVAPAFVAQDCAVDGMQIPGLAGIDYPDVSAAILSQADGSGGAGADATTSDAEAETAAP